MNPGDALLVFLDAHNEYDGWMRLSAAGVAARGPALEGLPDLVDPATGDPIRVVAMVPGETVSVHWLEVPGDLAPAQAAAAARLIASEVSAQPLVDMHVAVGPEAEGGAVRAVALVPALTMAGWVGKLQAHGLDPDLVLPAPLLLPAPESGFVRHARGGDMPLYRGPNDAFSIEPELAAIVTRGAPVADLDVDGFEAGLGQAIAAPPVNLRQGAFAKRTRWKIEWPVVRRLASMGAALLLLTLAIQFAAILRYTYAADALEAEVNAVASRALGDRSVSDGAAALERRVTELGGAGAGYSALASALFAAVRATPNVEMSAINFDRDGSLRATVQGDSPAAISSLQQAIQQAGFAAEPGAFRTTGGRPATELTVRAR